MTMAWFDKKPAPSAKKRCKCCVFWTEADSPTDGVCDHPKAPRGSPSKAGEYCEGFTPEDDDIPW